MVNDGCQPCGCDPGARWVCQEHRTKSPRQEPIVNPQSFIVKDSGFIVKDSGERKQFDSGMQRDTTTGKTDYTLVLDGPMFERWAAHLTAGAHKYDKRNWMKASGQEELDRFRESALRHFLQWFRGDVDEDHASAVLFNVNGAEFVKGRQ
jgi:hypothetical protein